MQRLLSGDQRADLRQADFRVFECGMQAGELWGPFVRKYAIQRADYPGAEVLLGRLAAR